MQLGDLIRSLQAMLADAGEHIGENEAAELEVTFKYPDGGSTYSIEAVRLTKSHTSAGANEATVWLEHS
jgi:hypothetical protein